MARKSPSRTQEGQGRQRHLAPTVYRPELGRNTYELQQTEAPLEGGDPGVREKAPRPVAFRRSARAHVNSRTHSDRSGVLAWNMAV